MTSPTPTPTIGRIVIYRNRAGIDMPAIITGLAQDPAAPQAIVGVHLTCFPPPGEAPDYLDPTWGVRYRDDDTHDGPADLAGRWRWPDRTENG